MRPKLSTRLTRYLAGLRLTSGAHAGDRLRLMAWQRRLLGLFDAEGDVAVSMARGNAKTATVAAIAAAFVDPDVGLAEPGTDILVVASSHRQGRIAFSDVLAFLGQRHDLTSRSRWRVSDTVNNSEIRHVATGTRVLALGSDYRRAHGLRPGGVILCDEPAMWEPGKADAMVAALRTPKGKSASARFVWLGTRPAAGTGHFFDAELERENALVYAADPEADPWKVSTWHRANPALRYLPSLRRALEDEAELAKRDPAIEASFRALRLNLGGSGVATVDILAAGLWEQAERRMALPTGAPVLGLDLAHTQMAGAAVVWPSGRCDAFGVVPEHPGLSERGRVDHCGDLYVRMHGRGELLTLGHLTVDVPALLAEAVRRWGVPRAIICDRWREGELRQALAAASFPHVDLIVRGSGYRDQSEDVRRFQRAVADGWLCAPKSLLLRAALNHCQLMTDPAGNCKIARHGPKQKNDAAVALVIATGEADRRRSAAQDSRPGFAVA